VELRLDSKEQRGAEEAPFRNVDKEYRRALGVLMHSQKERVIDVSVE
jgi:hypothetical protein